MKAISNSSCTLEANVDNGSKGRCDVSSSTIDSSEPSIERYHDHPNLVVGDLEEKLKSRADSHGVCMNNAHEDNGQMSTEEIGDQIAG
ncbi:hypothetical protein Ancab_020031 [Ancistrocladus abbreviatus]